MLVRIPERSAPRNDTQITMATKTPTMTSIFLKMGRRPNDGVGIRMRTRASGSGSGSVDEIPVRRLQATEKIAGSRNARTRAPAYRASGTKGQGSEIRTITLEYRIDYQKNVIIEPFFASQDNENRSSNGRLPCRPPA